MLDLWNDGAAKERIMDFVRRVSSSGSQDYVEPAVRVAVFDNDGTLWTEKPLPVELAFILQRLAQMADHDASLRDKQPWKAAFERDYKWLGDIVTQHYNGDDSSAKVLIGGILQAFCGMTVEQYQAAAAHFLQQARHPHLGRRFRDCGYAPMVELLRYLEAHGFTNYIASSGTRDFMRVFSEEIYGIPYECVVGSSHALRYTENDEGGTLAYLAEMDVFDDGPVKPVRIWSRVGRRPIFAFGNSNGDIPMLQFTGGGYPTLQLLLLHDDAARELAYVAGAEKSLELASAKDWVVVSMKQDWKCVFDADAGEKAG